MNEKVSCVNDETQNCEIVILNYYKSSTFYNFYNPDTNIIY